MFKQYPKGKGINQKIIESIVCTGLYKMTDWLCFEKIHGANGCIIVGDNNIQFARRRAIVDPSDKFYNYEKIVDKYKDKLRQLYINIVDVHTTVTVVRVYGELYGGIYPGQKSVDIPVQQGVYYSPNVEFMAFDIHIDTNDGNSEWLSYKKYSSELGRVGIPYIVPLFEGSFKDAIKVDNYFVTTIPKIHGLPLTEGNICEGIVIKPSENILLDGEKIMIKSKNDKFTEKAPASTKNLKITEIPEEIRDLSEYINNNRLDAAISKIGEPGPENMGKIIKEFISDILEEYIKDHELTKETKKILGKTLCSLCVPLVKNRIGFHSS